MTLQKFYFPECIEYDTGRMKYYNAILGIFYRNTQFLFFSICSFKKFKYLTSACSSIFLYYTFKENIHPTVNPKCDTDQIKYYLVHFEIFYNN